MNILKKALNSRIFENFVSLSIVHYLNYIIPLFTVPYTVRVLGPEKYGLMAFSYAIIFYFSIIVDYGFNYSATKDISLNRSNIESISRIFSETIIVKLFFFFLCGIFMMSLTIFLKNFAKERLFYFISFLTIIGNVLIPSFIFQGI
ncbi:MAG: oligosaccharide flippase family protein, partial [Elusimicrobia bacterium]|nr:oligosaccharide flippase family protein [Elusimicrobiota bacterium]